jgi:hypothetical protein
MAMNDALDLMIRDTRIGFNENEAIFCYGLCKMTVINESVDS